jgi:hypothetical protein
VESHDSSMTAQLSTHTRTPLAHTFHAQAEPHNHTCSDAHQLHTILHSHACTLAHTLKNQAAQQQPQPASRTQNNRYKQCAITHACSVSPCQWQPLIQHPANTPHVCLSLCVNAPPSAAPNPTCTRPHTPPPFRAAPLAQHSTAQR